MMEYNDINMSEKKINVTVDGSIELDELERDTHIMLQLDNGEQIFGLFREVDGDTVILKAKNNDNSPCLGWPLNRVVFWGIVEELN